MDDEIDTNDDTGDVVGSREGGRWSRSESGGVADRLFFSRSLAAIDSSQSLLLDLMLTRISWPVILHWGS